MPAAWIGAAVGVYGAIKGSKGSGSSGSSSAATYDPYAPYRAGAATQLNALMADPNSAVDSSYGQALQQGAARSMAAQGYTGSGNALVAAANAGGTAYQQQFNNLAMLSGASQGPANGAGMAAQQGNYNQQQSNQMWNQLGGLAQNAYNSWGSNGSTGSTGDSSFVQGNGTGGYGMQTQTTQSPTYSPNYFSW